MKPVVKSFRELSAAELYEILRLREAVFIVEQNCPYPEADGKALSGSPGNEFICHMHKN